MSALDAIGSMALAAQHESNERTTLVLVEREARCEGCGRRIAPKTEGRRVAPGSLVHLECVGLLAGPGGR